MNEHDLFRENADLLRGFEERPLSEGTKVPESVLFELEEARQKAVQSRKRSEQGSFIRRYSGPLRLAAMLVLLAAASWLLLPANSPVARVVITSPGDVISDTRPRIAWTSKDKPGQKYDVWILPAEGDHLTAPVLFVAKSVTSPVRFEQLQPGPERDISLQRGVDYRVLVCLADAGRTAGVPVPFKVK